MPDRISKNVVLKILEKADHKGCRIPHKLAYVTVKREKWARKKRMMRELELLKEHLATITDEQKRIDMLADCQALQQKIDAIDVGGSIVQHDQIALSGTRGMHAAKQSSSASSAA